MGPSTARRDLLILRDPFNLFASRQRSGIDESRQREGESNLVTCATANRLWKQHAREFIEPGRYLPHQSLPTSYNAWASDAGYRRHLARVLGLPCSDAGAGAATEMPVLQRWRHYADDPAFWEVFDDEMIAFADEIFGLAPEPALQQVPA